MWDTIQVISIWQNKSLEWTCDYLGEAKKTKQLTKKILEFLSFAHKAGLLNSNLSIFFHR